MSFNSNLHENEENEKIDNIINGVTTHYNWFYNLNILENKDKFLFQVPDYYLIEYTTIKKGKITLHQFEDDEKLYNIHNLSYMLLKKKLLKPFKILLNLMNEFIDEDIRHFLNVKFFNNLNKADYYNMCAWFVYLFYYYFKILLNNNNIININYRLFRQWCLNNKIIERTNTTGYNIVENEAIKKILLLYKNEMPDKWKNNDVFKGLFNHFLVYVQNGSGYRLH